MRLHHIGLSVGDLDAAIAWYGGALGYESTFVAETPTMRVSMGRLGDGTGLELLERVGSASGAQGREPDEALLTRGYGHIALEVDDLDATVALLVARRARVVWAPRASPEPGVRMAFVHDPEGNLIELLARDAAVVDSEEPEW